jgi:predicted DsbA family dithiol-disulfide isomerase
MHIDIISDTVCPWCFIGKRRLEKAMSQRPDMNFEVLWRPFQLNPDMPREGMDRRQYVETKFGGRERAKQIYEHIEDAGRSEGIAFAYDKIARTPNTLDSHRLIKWAATAGVQDAAVEALFRRYFLEGGDIGDAALLTEVAREIGMDAELVAELLAGDSDLEQTKAEDVMARQMGVTGVPCFIIGRKYAVSGAQDPAVLVQAFDLVAKEGEGPAAAAEAD